MNSRFAGVLSFVVLTAIFPKQSDSTKLFNSASFQWSVNSSLILRNVPQDEVRSVVDCASRCIGSSTCSQFCYSVTSKLCYLSVKSQLSLNDVNLFDVEEFVCYDEDICASAAGYSTYGGRCLKFHRQKNYYYNASQICADEGGHLYYFKSRVLDKQPMLDLLSDEGELYTELWVGATCVNIPLDCAWGDSSPVSDELWRSGDPNNVGNESCVRLWSRFWDLGDAFCSDVPRRFVCQIDV